VISAGAFAATRRGGAVRRAISGLERHGGPMIVAARFVPAGRTAVSLAAGATGYGLSRFSPFTALAASVWALYGRRKPSDPDSGRPPRRGRRPAS
jgi:membrane protein DedA with SNARE-associated domain